MMIIMKLCFSVNNATNNIKNSIHFDQSILKHLKIFNRYLVIQEFFFNNYLFNIKNNTNIYSIYFIYILDFYDFFG